MWKRILGWVDWGGDRLALFAADMTFFCLWLPIPGLGPAHKGLITGSQPIEQTWLIKGAFSTFSQTPWLTQF